MFRFGKGLRYAPVGMTGLGVIRGYPCAVVVLRAKCGGSSPSAQNDKQKQKAKAGPLRG